MPKTNVIKISKEHDERAWVEARKSSIGGSDASVVCGLNPYKTAVELWLEKTGQIEPADLSDNEKVYWGNALEDIIAQEFATRNNAKIQRRNAIIVHPKYDFITANVDRFYTLDNGEKGVLEVKNVGLMQTKNWQDDAPEMYQLQLQHYLAVTGLQFGCIVALIGGQEYVQHFYHRNDILIENLIKLEKDFWECVLSNQPPISDEALELNVLELLFPNRKNAVIELPQIAEIAELYAGIKENLKLLTAKEKELKNRLATALQDYKQGVAGDYIISISKFSSNRIDGKRLKAEEPEIYEQYCKESTTTRFNFKQIKEN